MSVLARLAAFAAVLAVAFGAAALAGAAIGPTKDAQTGPAGRDAAGGGHSAMVADEQGGGTEAAGLAVSDADYTLAPERTRFAVGKRSRLGFRILGAGGRALRDGYELESARELHLIIVRRDTVGYQHLHPRRDARGTWSVDLTLPRPGTYRAFADFQVDGRRHVLATDLFVPGDFRPELLPEQRSQARVGGYDVALQSPDARAGRETALTFAVTRGGRPVRTLEPYLGAKGHLVALREGDLAYLHVHPEEAGLAANQIRFAGTFPTAGRYRLFLQFKRAGEVHTAAYTVEVSR